MSKKLCNILFCSALFVFTFEYLFGIIPFISKYKLFLSIFEYVLLFLCIIKQSVIYKGKELIKIFFAIIITFCSYLITKDSSFFTLTLFLVASRNINVDSIIKFDLKAKLFLLFLLIFFLLTGIMTNNVVYRLDGTVRNTFGFTSPNTIGLILMSLCFDFVYVQRNNINIKTYIIIILVAILNLIFTDSRASSFSMILFVFLLFLCKRKIKINKIAPYIMPLFLVSCYVIMILYGKGNTIALKIDDIVTTRIKVGYNFYNLYGIHILGNNIPNVTTWSGYVNYLDNAYLNLLINHGLLVTLLFTIYFCLTMFKLSCQNKKIEISILIVFLIYGLFERSSFLIIYNIFLLLGTEVLYNEKK